MVARPRRVDRRAFWVSAWQAASFLAVGTLVESCGGSPTSPSGSSLPSLATLNGSFASGVVSVTIGADGPFGSVGGSALVNSPAGSFLVVRTAQDAFNVMTAICTHQQCIVSEFANQTFRCPCHGSQYNTTGGVVNGPATQSLRRFTAAFSNNVLTFTL